MAEESEKRFHAAMDKLFFAPPRNSKAMRTPPSTSVITDGLIRGKKRLRTMITNQALVELKSEGKTIKELQNAARGAVQSSACRPWDREDLLKRLATFKSMTWFAKPEVVSAINCARRGWVNVDMDIIACESCGARLFFLTPSSWAQQQVENAASVFSLKLNNGHKSLCPWVDNACDEKLAQFPPTSPADLVDNYKKRCASLLQLLELPLIITTPLLDFLKCAPTPDECEQVSPVLYYKAQKLISLCGWEPRLLPYIVDCKDVQNANITACPSKISENVEANEGFSTENEKYDHSHKSAVLECMLCGARVGLWAFHTTSRPAEFVRLVGPAELNDKTKAVSEMDETNPHIQRTSNAENGEKAANNANSSATSLNRNVLNLTIAGGPLPAEQNFQPTISLPVVGKNLRTCFSSAFEPVDDDHRSSTSNGLVETTDQPKKFDGKAMEFDPIKQHRHFCPWIASNGKLPPGWKQTLSALEHEKEFVHPSFIFTH